MKVAVRAIREVLRDDAGSPRYIETVGRGMLGAPSSAREPHCQIPDS
jgi:hypothetical protein